MSFYEGCGPDISPKSGANNAEYTDELIAVTRHLKHNQRDMMQSFAIRTRLPMDIIKIAAKYPSSKITNSDWPHQELLLVLLILKQVRRQHLFLMI